MKAVSRADRGAIAVTMALTVTLVLVPVVALAVDLGSVYVRESDLQQIADVAARAGAAELAVQQHDGPTPNAAMEAARAKAAEVLCTEVSGRRVTPNQRAASGRRATPNQRAASCAGPVTWAQDGDPSNGEISFFTGAPTTDHAFPSGQDAVGASPQDWVTGIRVVTPPLEVRFGLAAAFTKDHATLRKASTAGLFTVLPRYGILPMYLAGPDSGPFCTRSAPRAIWQPTHPTCAGSTTATDTTIARGYLTGARTRPAENATSLTATTWNTATGFDTAHAPLPGRTATLARQDHPNRSALVRDLSTGLFSSTGGTGAPARLKGGTCRGGYSASSGPWSGLESAYLTDFLNPTAGGRQQLRALLRNGATPTSAQRGWLDPDILRCGRLAAVPVLAAIPNPPPVNGLTTLSYPVTSLRLVWLDDRLWETEPRTERAAWVGSGRADCLSRGFYWADPRDPSICRNDLRAYTGYVLDPRFLPATVSGPNAANVVNQFVGSGLPATVRLLRDASDPPPR